jgi:antitoxin VapB
VVDIKQEGGQFEPAARTRAKLFTHGGSQAVRLPKAFRFEGDEVEVRKDGDRVILEPVRKTVPATEAERIAFWARIDALRGDQPLQLHPWDEPLFRTDPDA